MMNSKFITKQIGKIFPSKIFNRYIIVGAWNTFFGYGVFAGLTWLFTGRILCDYMVAAVFGNVISITQSFLSHKFFVFQTRGNYFKEYLRCWVVYGGSSFIGLLMLPIVVNLLNS